MSNKRSCYIGIDTSNYTTSFAVCDGDGKIVANIKKLLDVKMGEKGLRQSDAVFSHIKNFPVISDKIREATRGYQIKGVGVSTKPRDAEGSYMPCFMTGKAVAETLAACFDVPLCEFSHQSGHVMAALYSSGNIENLINKPFIAFHVSGGTTEAVYVRRTDEGFSVDIVAETADISAGQAIDRAGVLMGLAFPCGRELENLANGCCEKLPKAKICVRDGKCNLSGLENIAEKMYAETNDKNLVAAYVLNFVSETLEAMTDYVRALYPDAPVLYAGGVMGNKILQKRLSKYENAYFSEPEFSSDNGAGIALLTKNKIEHL